MPCCFQACPGWSSWGSWADCSVTCGGGVRSHTRVCLANGEPAKGCGGSSVDYSTCSTAVITADFTFSSRFMKSWFADHSRLFLNAEILWHAFPHFLRRHVQHGVSGTLGDAAVPLVVEEPDCVQGLAWMGTLGQLDARGLLCSPRHAPRRLAEKLLPKFLHILGCGVI